MKREGADTILVIHDSPELLHAIARPLRHVGYQVLTAPDSQAGLELAERKHPDLIISDELMPGINGIEWRRWRSRAASLCATPLLLMSGQQPDTARAPEGRAEADDYLASPLEPLLLIAKVTRLLERKHGEEALRKETKLVGLLRDVASAANEAASIHEAVLMCFDQLCALTQCQVGHLYLTAADAQRELIPTSFWHTENPAQFKKFMEVTEGTRIALGSGFVGQAFATGQPSWSLDLSKEPTFLRAKQAAEASLHTGFAFPILTEAEVVGVLEFFSREAVPPDASLLEVMTIVGVQLGRVVERGRAEKALRESASKYQLLMEQASDGILIIAQPGRYLSLVNSKACEMLGYRLEEFLELELEEIFLPEELAVTPLRFRELDKGGTLLTERRLRRKDGTVFTAELSTRKLEDRIQVIFRDVTARKIAEEALRRSEEQYRSLIANIPDVTWTSDSNGHTTFISPNVERVYGFSAEEICSDGDALWTGRIQPDDLARVLETYHSLFTGDGTFDVEYRIQRKDGVWIWIQDRAVATYEKDGVRYADGVFSDITDRKRAEEALRESEERFRIAMEAARIGTWDIDLLTSRAARSSNFERMLGLMSGATDGSFEEFMACVHPEDREFVTRKITESIENKAADHEVEYRVIWPDDSIHWLAGKGRVLYDDAGQPVRLVGVAMDLTEQKVLESQLRQAQKLESIGQLAAGIAHEINTPTQYVGDNTHFLQDAFGDLTQLLKKHQQLLDACRVGAPPPALVAEVESLSSQFDLPYLNAEIPKAIQQSLEGISRVTNIVQSMKDFAHPSSAEKQSADLNKAIESTITVARNEWRYVAEMVTDFDPNLPPVPCMLSEFNQVILNMIINATHAIADVVGDGERGKGQITIATRRDGEWVLVSITDTGSGIPEKIRDKVFDPFFTTKQVGKGTGQGLAISHTVIVEKHGGGLSFKTEEGRGTTFFIRLPLKEERLTPNRERQAEVSYQSAFGSTH